MASPRVFISSTCYDLKYIRENLKYFIKTLGYEPVLSEEGSIFYNPAMHTHDACVAEVPNTQMFVLIIGGRFGGEYRDAEHSITNAEYREAVKLQIPIFALVDQQVYNDHHFFSKNRGVDLSEATFPAVDNIKIFDFIDEVRSNSINNAIVPFRDFSDIETYLRQQWAGMMYSYLTNDNESKRLTSTLMGLEEVNDRIEMISKKILESVGSEKSNIEIELFGMMIKSDVLRTLSFWGASPKPASILINATFRSCAKSLGVNLQIEEDDDSISVGGDGSISRLNFENQSNRYKMLRQEMIDILSEKGYTPEQFLEAEPNKSVQPTAEAAAD